MTILKDFINNLKVSPDQSYGRLVIKPLFGGAENAPLLMALEEALEQNLVHISEKNEGGSVPELFVKNTGVIDVIILEGETVNGGKQNRSINATIIVPAGGEAVISVSCVESGRWRWSFRSNFSSGGSVLYPSLRAESHKAVTRNLRNHSHRSDQSGVWNDISLKGARLRVQSDTGAVSDVFSSAVNADDERALADNVTYLDGQVGFLAFIGGGFAGGDIFSSPELCKKQLKKLLRGLQLDAIDSGLRFPVLTAEEVLSEIVEAGLEQCPTIGKGEEKRFETTKIAGALKLVDGKVANLTVFPASTEHTGVNSDIN